jgi:glycosyltransferase involved in cell wall biosynthesis
VTPSYNQARFLEQTILSVLNQGYPNLEYIIMDGGSTDSSVEIIKNYEKWLTYWVSEPDRGQSHAINKGFSKASGEIYTWLNSDDYLLKDALRNVAVAYYAAPKAGAWVGGCLEADENAPSMSPLRRRRGYRARPSPHRSPLERRHQLPASSRNTLRDNRIVPATVSVS